MDKQSAIIKFKQLLINMITSNLPPDTALEVLRKFYLLNLLGILGTIFLSLLGIISFAQGHYVLVVANFSVLSFLLYLFFYLRKTKRHAGVGIIGTIAMGVFFFFHVALGVANNTAFVWVFTYPLISLFLLGASRGSLAAVSLLAMICLVFVFGDRIAYFATYQADLILRLIATYVIVTLLALIMERVRHITQHRLQISNAKLEEAVQSLEQAQREKDRLILELQHTLEEVRTLQGIIPICASCKKIRDDHGFWQQVEEYLKSHSHAEFTHGICPGCVEKLYPGLYDEN